MIIPWRPPTFTAPEAVLLTVREADVLAGLVLGHSNATIARRLGTTLDTVKTQTTRLYRKLGVHDRAAAVAVAMSGRTQITVNDKRIVRRQAA